MKKTYTVLCPFGGIGGGALGFQKSCARVLGVEARFRLLGGIDCDADACKDFTALCKAPSLCARVEELRPEDLVAAFGPETPDVVFLSPPCVGASGLISEKKASTSKYRALNGLSLTWMRLMLRTWGPPRLILLENVPRLQKRASGMLKKLRTMLRQAGYVLHEGFHDCGEIGGLAQRRRRLLLVARHAKSVPTLLYQPTKLPVRACGDVLGPLPMPGDPAAGPMHSLPRISWLNWVRLALIPAGGDWRDLEDVLAPGQPRREKFRRQRIESWDAPSATISGPGANAVANVADPRPFGNVDRVTSWDEPVGTVTSSPAPSSGGAAVADPRPREWFRGTVGVTPWDAPSGTVTGNARASTGPFSVADPRAKDLLIPSSPPFDKAYGVLDWSEDPAHTVAAGSDVGQGAYAVADVRVNCAPRAGADGVLSWQEAAGTITGHAKIDNGRFAVADPRKPPTFTPIIIAKDGTWHRPLTTLELAALQDLPTIVDGAPLKLAGTSHTEWRRRIGNCVPRGAARRIGDQMLLTLLQADLGAFALSSGGAVWVTPRASALYAEAHA